MKTYKKGISLIVLVITVIVLAILATTVIISLSNTNIITEANKAVDDYNLKQYESQMNLAYASWLADNKNAKLANISELENYGFKALDLPAGNIATVRDGKPQIKTVDSVWDGTTVATSFSGGAGTYSDPYLISTAEELAYLSEISQSVEGLHGSVSTHYYVKLTADVDLAGHPWTPIILPGVFEGNGHTIYNLNVSGVQKAGLIAEGDATVSNLNLDGGKVSGTYAGAFVSDPFDMVIKNCNNYGVTVVGTEYACGIGGRWVDDCINYGSVYSSNNYAAGITYRDYSIISNNCINYGAVSGKIAAGIGIGDEATAQNSVNYGAITGIEEAYGITNGENTNCQNYGTVTVTGK